MFGCPQNSFLVLRRGRSGASRPATVSVHANSWLANPKKERRSVRLLCIGNLAITSVMDGSILLPSSDMTKLAKSTVVWAHCYFLMFSVMCFSLHCCRNILTWSACCVTSSNMTTSSTMQRNPESPVKASSI